MPSKDSIVIGIAGGSGSGKTTFASKIISHLNSDDIILLQTDDYYKDGLVEQFGSENVNFDHPDSIDSELLEQQLINLCNSQSITAPRYDFTQHARIRYEECLPKKIIILEGLFSFCFNPICQMLDLKIFLDYPADIRLLRRIRRDTVERGRSLGSVLSQYENTVRPMHEQYIEPSKFNADIIVGENGFDPAAYFIAASIRNLIMEL